MENYRILAAMVSDSHCRPKDQEMFSPAKSDPCNLIRLLLKVDGVQMEDKHVYLCLLNHVRLKKIPKISSAASAQQTFNFMNSMVFL